MNPLTADAVEEVAAERGATDHRARRDRAARVGERELEQEERQERDARSSRRCRGAPFRKKYWCPIQPLPVPNMNAKPNAQNKMPHRHVSAMHSSMMFETSRVRAKPASEHHEARPA